MISKTYTGKHSQHTLSYLYGKTFDVSIGNDKYIYEALIELDQKREDVCDISIKHSGNPITTFESLDIDTKKLEIVENEINTIIDELEKDNEIKA